MDDLIFVCVIAWVLLPIPIAVNLWVLAPVRQLGIMPLRARFGMLDFACLLVVMQVPLSAAHAALVAMFASDPNRLFVYVMIVVAAVGMWWMGIRQMELLRVQRPLVRVVYSLGVVPAAYALWPLLHIVAIVEVFSDYHLPMGGYVEFLPAAYLLLAPAMTYWTGRFVRRLANNAPSLLGSMEGITTKASAGEEG